ncbi:MAG: hypothetical protein ACRCYY_16395 [Trueperaceae bacterium]
MASYLYLNNIETNHMLRDDEWQALSGDQEYEAKNSLPLFWLCMFSEHDIAMTHDDVQQGPSYPYLLSDQGSVMSSLDERRHLIACLNPAHLALYDSFCRNIRAAVQPYWLLRTRDIVDMNDTETFAHELVRTFAGMTEYLTALYHNDAGNLQGHWFAAYLAEVKQTHSSYLLAGASTDSSWLPNEVDEQTSQHSTPLAALNLAPSKGEKKWWQFWKT